MTVLIDPPSWPAHGRLWSHLASDVSFEELHAFAGALGVPARGFEGDHYDLPEERYQAAVAAGAIPVPTRELLHRLRAAGLRRPKRRGEKVLASLVLPEGRGRVDILRSTRAPRQAPTDVVLLATDAASGSVLTLAGPAPPRRSLSGDRSASDAAAGLLASHLLGPVRVPVRQIGHVRHLGPAAEPVRVDVVLHAQLDRGTGYLSRHPAQWVDAGDFALVQPLLAPLLTEAWRAPQ